jgi:alpha-ketoglutaric semialdehyde dehydrogenase
MNRVHFVLVGGQWQRSRSGEVFRAVNPATGEQLADEYPVSGWADCDAALEAAASAAAALRAISREHIARFLNVFAERLEQRKSELVEQAYLETALARTPRLADVELPRTTNQLRQGAEAVSDGSWALPTIDTKLNIRSHLEPLGPVVVFGPNNFPFAFNGVAGGDFVAAIAAGNPVIAKAHPLHPGTSRLLAEEAHAAVIESGLPASTVQLLYHMPPDCGLRMVSDARVGATAFTGSRAAGLSLKAAADAAGKPIYLEMSSVNPVIILPGALAERGRKVAEEFAASSLLGGGQFCTNPGLVILFEGGAAEQFVAVVKNKFESAPASQLFSEGVARSLGESVRSLRAAGAVAVTGDRIPEAGGCRCPNSLLRATGQQFLEAPDKLQREAFGAAALLVFVKDARQVVEIINHLEGTLTGCIYSDSSGLDDDVYGELAPLLQQRVGRLLNDKMPTGVAVSPAMNHGGPYPATAHPGFTAVGIPASLRRFAALRCYDGVRSARLPDALRDHNANGRMWRFIDGRFTQGDAQPL